MKHEAYRVQYTHTYTSAYITHSALHRSHYSSLLAGSVKIYTNLFLRKPVHTHKKKMTCGDVTWRWMSLFLCDFLLPLQTCPKSSGCRPPAPLCCCCPTKTVRRCGRCCACWVTWRPACPRTRWPPPTWPSVWPRPSSTSTPCGARRAPRRGACPSETTVISAVFFLWFHHWHSYCINSLHNM